MPPPHNPPFSSSLPPPLRRLTPPGSLPLRRTASRTAEAATVSPYALTRPPSVSTAEAKQESVVRVYSSDGCPVAWRLRVSLLYKAAAPVHFTPFEAAPLGRSVLRLSTPDPEVSGAADKLLRQELQRFNKPWSNKMVSQCRNSEHRVFLIGENRWEDPSRMTQKNKPIGSATTASTKKSISCRGEGRLMCVECDETGEPNIELQFYGVGR